MDRAGLIRLFARKLAASDPAAALPWLAALPPGDDAQAFAPEVARRWLSVSPAAAPALIFAGDLRSPVMKAAAPVAIAGMVRTDPRRFLDSLEKLPLDAASAEAFRLMALEQLATVEPAALLDWAQAHPGTALPPGAVRSALLALAETDLPKALAAARSQPPGDLPGLMTGLFHIWLAKDRDAAMDRIAALPAGGERDGALTALLESELKISGNDALFAAICCRRASNARS